MYFSCEVRGRNYRRLIFSVLPTVGLRFHKGAFYEPVQLGGKLAAIYYIRTQDDDDTHSHRKKRMKKRKKTSFFSAHRATFSSNTSRNREREREREDEQLLQTQHVTKKGGLTIRLESAEFGRPHVFCEHASKHHLASRYETGKLSARTHTHTPAKVVRACILLSLLRCFLSFKVR